MKKLLVVLTVGLAVAFFGNAFAADPPPGASESAVYWDSAGVWVYKGMGEDANGRLFRAGVLTLGNCNKKYWDIDVYIYAKIAQWIDFRLDYNEWHWYIRKPGCYAGNCIEGRIASNGDVYVDFEGFGPLMPQDDPTHNPIDSIFYGVGEIVNDVVWTHCLDLNNADFRLLDTFEDDWQLHYGISWKLWTKICVDVCNSACDYMDDATITLTLEQQKTWINWDTGEWNFSGGF
jgi:hypothetical protein